MLRTIHSSEPQLRQIILPESLRARVCHLAHHSVLAGHPGQTRMHETLRWTYYLPSIASDIMFTIRTYPLCAKNRVRLIKHPNPMNLFPATTPLESGEMDLLGPLPPSKRGHRFILVMTDRFSNLTQVVAMKKTIATMVAAEFCLHWMYKYGAPKETLTDNGPYFASKFLQEICQVFGISNAFISMNHPQTNGQAERYNRTLTAMLRCFVDNNPSEWDVYAPALTYAYKMQGHRATGTRPFNLVLSRPPP